VGWCPSGLRRSGRAQEEGDDLVDSRAPSQPLRCFVVGRPGAGSGRRPGNHSRALASTPRCSAWEPQLWAGAAQAVGDDLVDSIVSDNIPILTEAEKFNETLISSVKRVRAHLLGARRAAALDIFFTAMGWDLPAARVSAPVA